ncbi:ribonuclease H-like domain-containing protein [Tanacetum coccineum]
MESQLETTQTVSILKLLGLKTREYDLWSMRMEQYFTFTDHALWEVIVNGDSVSPIASASASAEGPIPPKTTEQKLARKNELKAKSILMLAIHNEHLLKFHTCKDAKPLWEAIKNRFQKLISQLEIHGEVVSQEDTNLKLLRSLQSAWNNIALIMRNKSDLDTLSMDDLYNNLKVNTNEIVNTAHSVSAASFKDQASTASYVDDLIFSFFANQSNALQFDNEDLEQIDVDNLEEMDLKWQVAMLTIRVKRAPRNQGKRNRDDPRRNAPVDTSTSNALVVQDGIGYQMGLESLEARIVVHEKNKAIYEEDIAFLNCESDGDDNPVNDRFKRVKGYHAVPSNYTGNYMPSRPDISFVGLDDYVYKTKVSETETSISKTSKDILEKPKTVRPSAPIIKEWDIDSDNDTDATKSGQVASKAAKQKLSKSTASIRLADLIKDFLTVDSLAYDWKTSPFLQIIKKIDGGYFVAFLEEVPKGGTGPNWMFDIDTLTMSMNYQPVFAGNQTNGNAGTKANIDEGQGEMKTVPGPQYVLLPFLTSDSQSPKSSEDEVIDDAGSKRSSGYPSKKKMTKGGQGSSFTTMDPGRERAQRNEFKSMFGQDKDANGNSIYRMFTPINTAGSSCNNLGGSIPVNAATLPNVDLPTDPLMPKDITDLLNTGIFNSAYDDEDVGAEADLENLETTVNVSLIPSTRIHKDHPKNQIIGDINSATQTKRMIKSAQEHAMVSYIKRKRRTNHKDDQNCLFAYFLSQIEPKKVTQALTDPSWIEAMQDELLRKKDKRWIVVRNKERLVAQGYTQEEGIDYDELFAPISRIEAIRLFLAYASFMGFIVYQMDAKSAFLYGTIEEESKKHQFLTHATIEKLVAHSVATVLKAQAAIMASTNNPNSKLRKTSVSRKCAYKKFTSYQLFYFNGTDGAVGLIRWFKWTESIFSRSKCAEKNKLHRQRSYANVRRKPLELQVGNRVMLKASPRKDIFRFGKRGKLNPRYIGPFKILERIDPVAYKLELPKKLSSIHISNLKKCLSDESFIIPIKEL